MCNLDMYLPWRSKWLLILDLGGDGGSHGGDGDEPAAAAAAAAGGERRGEAERDVVEAERHRGGQWEGEPEARPPPPPQTLLLALARLGCVWWCLVASARNEQAAEGACDLSTSGSGSARAALGF